MAASFDAANSEIRLRNPRLPSFIDEMTIRNLSLTVASVDLALHRHGDEVSVRVIRSKGEVQVSAFYARTGQARQNEQGVGNTSAVMAGAKVCRA